MKLTLLTLVVSVLTMSTGTAQTTVVLQNDQSQIEIVLNGAFPVSWTVEPLGADREFVQLVSQDYVGTPFGAPFQLILDGDDGPLTTFANATTYTATEEDGNTYIFQSDVHDSGLQIEKSIGDIDGYTAVMSVRLLNVLNVAPIELENPYITLGPGIGRTPNLVGGLGDAMYSYVDAVALDGGVRSLEPESERYAIWSCIHDRYYTFLVAVGELNLADPDAERRASPVLRMADADDERYNPSLRIGFSGIVSIAPGEQSVFDFKVYAGPKDRTLLTEAGIDPLLYSNLPGPLRWLCLVLGDLLRFMYAYIGSWWLTIVAFTVLIRIALFPLTQKTITMNAQMMADQAKLKPLIDEIKQKYKNAQTQYDKTMALYKEHGINPLAPLWGCLPVLLQLPILIAIFNILGQEVTLQGARLLWIDDLSLPDRLFPLGVTLPYFGSYFNLLPVLMAVVMVLTTNFGSPADGDQKRSQMKSMVFLAVVFFALFYSFPAGLVLYWTLSNVGQYAQQVITNRLIANRAAASDGNASPPAAEV